jgi:tellurite resistance protein
VTAVLGVKFEMELIALVAVIVAVYLLVKLSKSFRSQKNNFGGVKIEVQVTPEATPSVEYGESEELGPPDLYYFPVESTPRKIAARLKLRYVSTSGQETDREIDVRVFYRGQGGCHFEGFDHLRNARRKLSSKCVKDAVDLETGESLSDLVAFFEHKYLESPEYLYDYLFEKHGAEIYVFVYLAAADGAVRAQERNIIARYCLDQEGFQTLDAEKVDDILKKMYKPSKHDFHRCVREMKLDSTDLNKVWSVANAIAGTSAKPHSEHTRALEYMQKQWKQKIAVAGKPVSSR